MISNKKFLLLSLLMTPALRADCCDKESSCCNMQVEQADVSQKSADCVTCETMPETGMAQKASDCVTCETMPAVESAQKSGDCVTCAVMPMVEMETEKKSSECCDETVCESQPESCTRSCQMDSDSTCNEENDTETKTCSSCCCEENSEMDDNDDMNFVATVEENDTKFAVVAVVEAERIVAHLFRICGGLSQAYIAMSQDHKMTFAKTLVDFFMNIQNEIKAHSELFNKMGSEYVKACENLKFTFTQDPTKSEEDNLKANFAVLLGKIAQFYVDFGYVYKNLTPAEQDELAQIPASVYLQQKELCKESATSLREIVQIFSQVITAKI